MPGSVVAKGALRGAPDSPAYLHLRNWKSLAGNVVAKAPSTVLQALKLTDLHSNVEKFA